MRSLKFIALSVAAALMLAAGAEAVETGFKTIKGNIVSIDVAASSVVVNTEVAGSKVDVTYKLSPYSIVTICWADVCESKPSKDGLAVLNAYNKFDTPGIHSIGKSVSLVYDKEGKDIARLHIDYTDYPIHSGSFGGTYDYGMGK